MPAPTRPITKPSDVPSDLGFFDHFAQRAAEAASRAPFFAVCVLLVVAWLLQGVVNMILNGDPSSFLSDRFQLEINTTTTIITFLMVALLQNAGTRNDLATQDKLNAIATGLADLMEHTASATPGSDEARLDLENDLRELREAVGLELRESTSKHSLT
jgi:low affinity Fe/Cu permease